jgi:hypothetical protein
MIRFPCPKCEKRLSVDEAKAGQVGVCPNCKCKFRIPRLPESAPPVAAPPVKPAAPSEEEDERPRVKRRPVPEPVESDEDSPRVVRRRRIPEPEEAIEPALPRKRRRVVDDDEPSAAEEEEAPVRKRKKKKRRRGAPSLPLGLSPYAAVMLGAGILGAALVTVSFVWPVLAFLAIGLGQLVTLAASVWYLVIVFQDNVTSGVLCLLCCVYDVYYLVTNFEAVKLPFFMRVLGVTIVAGGMFAGGHWDPNNPDASHRRSEIQAVYIQAA